MKKKIEKKRFYVIFRGLETGVFYDYWSKLKHLTNEQSENLPKRYPSEAAAWKAWRESPEFDGIDNEPKQPQALW